MRPVNSYLLLVFLFCLVACGSHDATVNASKIDNLAKELVDEKWTVGLSIRMDVEDVNLIKGEYGFGNHDTKDPIQKHAQFRIASITKPITATAIMQLIERGLLSEKENIGSFFPDFPNGDKITVYQLLSHTSGIPNWWGWDGELPVDTPKNFPFCDQPHLYIQNLDNYTSLFEPGTHHAYSNSGYVLLGEIIEMTTGQSYDDYIQEHILLPAGMHQTEMEYIENPKEDWISGYAWNDFHFSAPDVYTMPFSAGGLRSTADDLMKLMKALQSGKLVSSDTYEMMTSYATLSDGRYTHENLYSDDGGTRFPSNIKKFGYGLGFQIVENYGTKVISHGGDIAGFNGVLMYVPKNKVTLIMLSNTENGIMSRLKKIEKLVTAIELCTDQI